MTFRKLLLLFVLSIITITAYTQNGRTRGATALPDSLASKNYVEDKIIWDPGSTYILNDIVNQGGIQYRLKVASSVGESPAANPLKWAPTSVDNPASVLYYSYTNEDVPSSIFSSGVNRINVHSETTANSSEDYYISLPDISDNNKTISILSKYQPTSNYKYIVSSSSDPIIFNGKIATEYYVDDDEKIDVTKQDSYWLISSNRQNTSYKNSSQRFSPEQIIAGLGTNPYKVVQSTYLDIDGIFARKVPSKIKTPINLVANSFYSNADADIAYPWVNGNPDHVSDSIDPFGGNETIRFVRNSTGGSSELRTIYMPYTFTAGDTITFSMYAKLEDGGAALDITAQLNGELSYNVVVDKDDVTAEWQKFTWQDVFQADDTNGAFFRLRYGSGNAGNGCLISGITAHIGTTAYPYVLNKDGTMRADSVYLIPISTKDVVGEDRSPEIVNLPSGVFNIDDFTWPDHMSRRDQLQYALDYVGQNRGGTVTFTDSIWIDETIRMGYSNLILQGNKDAALVANLTNPDSSMIRVDHYTLQQVTTGSIRDVAFVAADTAKSFITTDKVNHFVYSGISANGSHNVEYFYLGGNIPNPGLFNTFRENFITGVRIGYKVVDENEMDFYNCFVTESDVGWELAGGNYSIYGGGIEDIDSSMIRTAAGESIGNLNVEGIASEEAIKGEPGGYVISIGSARQLNLANCKFTVNPTGNPGGYLYLDAVTSTTIIGCNFEDAYPAFTTTANTGSVSVIGNKLRNGSFQAYQTMYTNKIYDPSKFYWQNNYPLLEENTSYNQRNVDHSSEGGFIYGGTFSDSMGIADPVLTNKYQNYVSSSDVMSVETNPNWSTFANQDTLPFDTEPYAEMIVANANFEGAEVWFDQFYTAFPDTTIDHVLSFWARGNSDTCSIQLQYSGYANGSQRLPAFNHTDWRRYRVRLGKDNSGDNSFRWSIYAGGIGDTAYIGAVQINDGKYPTTFARTTGSSVISGNPKFVIKDSGTLDIEGGLRLSTATNPYGGSNEIGAVIDSLRINNVGLAKLSFTNSSIDSSLFLNTSKSFDINLNTNSSSLSDYTLQLPDVSNVDSVLITLRRNRNEINYNYKIEAFDSTQLTINGFPVDRYFISKNETVSLESKDGLWKVTTDYKPLNGLFTNSYYNLGDKIGKYIVEAAPPKIFNNSSIDSYNNNLFVKKVLNKKRYTGNQFVGSEDQAKWGSNNVWLSVGVGVISNDEYGPFDTYGVKTAEKWFLGSAVTSGQIRDDLLDNNISLNPGDVFTVSGWIKPGSESYNDNITIRAKDLGGVMSPDQVTLDIDMTNKEWQYFENTFTWISGTDERVNFIIDGDPGDYVHVNRFNWSYGPSALEYNKTSPASPNANVDTIYAVYYPELGIARPGDIFLREGNTDNEIITQLFDYCKNMGLCKIVQLDRNLTTYGEIVVPDGMTLDLNGFTIDYQGDDNTVDIIKFVNDGISAYTENQSLKGPGIINAGRSANAGVSYESSDEIKFHDFQITGNDSLQYGIYDIIGGNSSLFPEFVSVSIKDCEVGHLIQSSNFVEIQNPGIIRNKYGLWLKTGSTTVTAGRLEACDTSALYVEAGDAFLDGVYFESTPTADFDSSYTIYLNGGGTFELSNLIFNGADYSPDAVIRSEDVEKLTIRGGYYSSGAGGLLFNFSCNTEKWDIDGITTQTDVQVLANYYRISKCLENGTIDGIPAAFYGNKRNNLFTKNSWVDSTLITGVTLGDTLKLSDLWLKSHRPNIGQNSEVLPGGTYSSGNITVVANAGPKWNGEIGVPADSTAELIYATSDVFSTASWYNWNLFDAVEAGKTYCIRLFAKRLGGTGNSRIIVRTSVSDESTIGISASDTIYREYWQQFTPATSSSTLAVRFGPWQEGDSILVSGLTINEGFFPEPYYFTDTADLGEEQPRVNINPGDTLKFNGNTSLDWQLHAVTTASTVTLNYPNNIISSTLNNGTFILDPSEFTGDNMIVKVNSFATDDVTLDASGSYNFTIGGTTQATYDLLGNGAYAEFWFNSSLGTFELQNTSMETQTISIDSTATNDGVNYTITISDSDSDVVFRNTYLSYQRVDLAADAQTLTPSAADNFFVFSNAVSTTQTHTVGTPTRNGTTVKFWTDATVSTTINRTGSDVFVASPGASGTTSYEISGAGLAVFQYHNGTWFKIN